MIYLDNSATTRPYSEVIDTFKQVSEKFYGNPSSIHRFGNEAERLLIKAKQQASNLLEVSENEIVFTSGGTEGNNTAIKGIAFAHQNRGKHIITSQIEHPSVLETCKALENIGYIVTYLPVNSHGVVSVEDVEAAITKETILISIMHVNNELGSIQPIEAIGSIAKKHPKLFFHVDHVQGFGKIPLKLQDSGIDMCTVSGHKINGLKGTGLLYIKKKTKLFPLLHGGNQEIGYRSGTENLAGIVSLVKAIRLNLEKQNSDCEKLIQLNKELRKCLETIKGIVINTPTNGAHHILNFSIPGYKPEVIIHALGEKGIYISTKSACSSKQPDKSTILAACGLSDEVSKSALRVSLSFENNLDDIDKFCTSLDTVIKQLSEVMG
ncbi:cysteine desulfurase family protein [Aquibacillus rhizosphaerae]|uniref:Cysteine desulfurase family protein n=1 Tax=Aquibacillus rhizosphaerae TaxID=3051431 RepID=A0ABT7L666_9BACI|nr:cysteine desulfurase family protein [Aquibacillus sp. LR5S19]MDL4841344.1 cysteine desulfurase family protein [Aquibacillus sp. LR5S19]